jgi:choline dehydrogenase-like flavoprotein
MYVANLPSDGRRYDVCVVGAGPVGLALALECEAAGLTVLLLDAGPAPSQRHIDNLRKVEIVDPSRHAALDVVTQCGLGGSTATWGGRCVPFDDIDFERRSFVSNSGWPISHQDVKPFYSKAASYLDCGTGGFLWPAVNWKKRENVLFEATERLSSQPRMAQRFKHKLKSSRLISVCLDHAVSSIKLDSDGNAVRSVQFASEQLSRTEPAAEIFVLACGGLQSTRILLDLQCKWPRRFGGEAGPLGRFYMGHVSGRIANIVLHNPADVEDFDYTRDADGYWVRRRLSFSPATQIQHELLSTVFWLGSPPFHDPAHGSATASTMYLALDLLLSAMPSLSSDSVRFHQGAKPTQLRKHLSNVFRNAPEALNGIARAAKLYLNRQDLRPLFVRNGRGRYALHYHSEQIPNPSSRVRAIRDRTSAIGMLVDLRFSEDDARSVVRAHEVLDDALRQSGKGYLEYWQKPEQRFSDVMTQALDGYHQIGTIRMGDSERSGVVDRNCQVHGLQNLYVAGSSVFNTSSQANPTFSAVAIAARLAEHLRVTLASPSLMPAGASRAG